LASLETTTNQIITPTGLDPIQDELTIFLSSSGDPFAETLKNHSGILTVKLTVTKQNRVPTHRVMGLIKPSSTREAASSLMNSCAEVVAWLIRVWRQVGYVDQFDAI